MNSQPTHERSWLDKAYLISVAVKGFDGLVELIAGIWLIVAPTSLHAILVSVAGEAAEHQGRFAALIAENVAHVDKDLAKGGLVIVVLFLISHGVVKLALVYALLRKILWAYPYALLVLTAFLVYQLYVCILHPSLGMVIFALLDAAIIWIVWREWRTLLAEKVV